MNETALQLDPRWPAAMSYGTLAKYLDLPGAGDPAKAERQGREFCERNGIPVIPVGGKYKRVRRVDVDKYLGVAAS